MFGNGILLVLVPLFIWGMAKTSKKGGEDKSSNWGWIIMLYSIGGFFLSSGYGIMKLMQNPDHVFPGYISIFFALAFTLAMIIKKPHTSV